MRVATTALILLCVIVAELPAQIRNHGGGFRSVTRMPAPPVPPIPQIHPVIPSFGGGGCYGPQPYPGYGYGYSRNLWGLGGYSYGGYYGTGFGGSYHPGWGGTSYSSISYGVPGLSVGYVVPFGTAYGYGYDPYNGGLGFGSAASIYVPSTPQLRMPQWVWDESGLNGTQPAPRTATKTHPSLVQPSTPEAQLRSARLQDAGDRLFQRLDYFAAEKSYAKAMQAAPDRPEPYLRLAIAKAARGDFRSAVTYIRQIADIDATYPGRADSMGVLFGHQNGIARLKLKQSVADWTNVDVRDPDRLYLLGVILFLEGDDRFKTILDTAVKLEGDKSYLTIFLNAPPANSTPLVLPAAATATETATDIETATEPTPVPSLPESSRPPLTVPVPEP